MVVKPFLKINMQISKCPQGRFYKNFFKNFSAIELTPEDNIPIGKNVLMLADVVDSDNYTCVEKSDLGNIESKPPSAGVMASRDESTREKYLKRRIPFMSSLCWSANHG